MKKILKYSALAVITACALVSCAKDELKPAETEKSLHFVINTAEETPLKSFVDNNLDGTYTPKWSKGDELAIFVGDITSSTESPTATLSNTAETGVTATFDGTVPTDLTDGSFLSFSPAGAFEKGYTDGTVGINLSEIQKPSSLTIDEACDVLVAKQCDFTADKGVVAINDLYFKRIFSIVKVNLNLNGAEALKNEKVTSFTLKAPATLTGRAAVDLSNASISKWNVPNQTVTAKYTTDTPVFGGENGRENTVWFVVNPTTVASGSTITFSGETENYTFSKEVTLTKDVVFPQGQLAVINLTIADGNYAVKTAETRILVEGFDNVSTNKSTPQPSVSGAEGTGVTEKLEYVYTSANVRTSSNGHSSSDYYLWNGTAAAIFNINNIAISDETSLLFSCQGRTSQSSTDVTISYKESSASDWINAGSFTATTSTFDTVQKFIFTVSSSATSLDIQITNVGGNLLLDDFVLESFVDSRTTLSTPTNVSVSVDAETPNTLNVSWDAVENASGYEVVLSVDGKEDIVKTATESTLAVSSLEYTTTYSVKVKATTTDVENYIESEYSAAVSGITGDKPAGAAEWVKTDISAISSSDVVVIVGSNYGIKNDNGTSSSPTVIAVTIANNKITSEVPDNIKWNISGNSTDGYIFYPNGVTTSWLYCNTTATSSSNNNIRVGTGDRKQWKPDENGYFVNTVGGSQTYVARYLSLNGTTDWRSYVNTSNNPQKLEFYVLQSSGSSEGGSDPVKLTAPVVSCSTKNANSLTFEWDAVANATGYQVSVDGGINYGTTQSETTYIWSGLDPETTKTLYVKAIGDGTSYTDSDAVPATGKTAASTDEGGEAKVYLSEDFSSLTTWSSSTSTLFDLTSGTWTASGSVYEQNGCIKIGKNSAATNTITTPALSSISGTANVVLTFKAVSSDAGYTMSVTANNAGTVGELSPGTITKYGTAINSGAGTATALTEAFASTETFTVTITGATSATTLTIQTSGTSKRWYLDDVQVVSAN